MNDTPNKEIVDRLKVEGNLLRNSGTNSIKSIGLKLEKFQDVFVSMNKVLVDQTNMIQEMLAIQKDSLELDIDTEEKRKRKEELERAEKTESIPPKERQPDYIGGRGSADMNLGGLVGPFIAFLSGTVSALSSVIRPANLARGLVAGGLALTLAPVVSNFLTDFIGKSLENFGLMENKEFKTSFGDEMNRVISWVGIGLALGGWWGARIGLMLAAGSFIWEKLDEKLNANETIRAITDAFGLNLPEGWEAGIGTAIGFAIVSIIPTILKKALPFLLKRAILPIAAATMAANVLKSLSGDTVPANSSSTRRDTGRRGGRAGRVGLATSAAEAVRQVAKRLSSVTSTIAQKAGPVVTAAVPVAPLVGAAAVTGTMVAADDRSKELNKLLFEKYPQLSEEEKNYVKTLDVPKKSVFLDSDSGLIFEELKEARKNGRIKPLVEAPKAELKPFVTFSNPSTMQAPEEEDIRQFLKEPNQKAPSLEFKKNDSPEKFILPNIPKSSPEISPSNSSIITPSMEMDSANPMLDKLESMLNNIEKSSSNNSTNIMFAPQTISPTNVVQGPTTISNVRSTNINSVTSMNSEYGGIASLS